MAIIIYMKMISSIIYFVEYYIYFHSLKNRQCGDFPDSPVAKTPCFQRRGPRLEPWLGNKIPHAAAKSSHATTKDLVCCN